MENAVFPSVDCQRQYCFHGEGEQSLIVLSQTGVGPDGASLIAGFC